MSEIGNMPLLEISQQIQERKATPVEITEEMLKRIETLDGPINSYITVTAELAREAAQKSAARWEAGESLGPLDGVPLAIKDLIDVAGVNTTNGMEIMRGAVAGTDAEVTRRLKEAGAVILGKLNMHEAAMGPTNDNIHFGRCHNPWKPGYSPGGSSGGSGASVAAGLCAGALGTDNMGSVRIPSAFCGIAGLKPTNGLVSTRGIRQLSWSTVAIGPMTRGVDGVALMMEVMAGHDPLCEDSIKPVQPLGFRLPPEPSVKGLRMGIIESAMDDSSPEIREAFAQSLNVLEAQGAELEPVGIDDLERARMQCLLIIEAEGGVALDFVLEDEQLPVDPEVRAQLKYGATMPTSKLVRAQRFRTQIQHKVAALFDDFDVLLSPTTPIPGLSFEAGAPDYLPAHMPLANLCNLPGLSVPMGFSAEGLPLGLQIMAAPLSDALTLRVGKAYEQATDWHTRRPA